MIGAKVIAGYERKVLGRMSVTYSGRRVTSTMDDWTEISKYRVVESGDSFVVFDQFSDVWKRDFRWKVSFVESGYWISNDEVIKGYTEKFDSVTK